MKQGAIAFITNEDRTKFLIQRKDSGYKYENQHRTICFFGGHVENNETPLEAILRELKEEIGHAPTVEAAVAYITSQARVARVLKSIVLESQNKPGTFFELFMFDVILSDKVFDSLQEVLYDEGVILEGYGEIVTKSYLDFICNKHSIDFFSRLSQAYKKFFNV